MEEASLAITEGGIMREFTKSSENELLDVLQVVIEGNYELTTALGDLRDSYCALLTEKAPAKFADEMLAQVDAALMQREAFSGKL